VFADTLGFRERGEAPNIQLQSTLINICNACCSYTVG